MSWQAIGEEPVRETLDSGLEIFVLPKPGLKKTYATYATHYGSIDSHFRRPGSGERVDVPDGIAHFLEHKMFEKETDPQVFERFAQLGAYSNAYTEYITTTFLFSATSDIQDCLETLLRVVEEPYFTEENVEKEKGIIEQEIRMYLDMPGERLRSNLMRALYHKNPVRLDIAGSVESIRTITTEDLYLCYHTFYHPSNMAIFVAGDVDPGRIIDHLSTLEKRRALKPLPSIERIFPEEPAGVAEKRVEQSMPVSTPLWLMGYKDGETGLSGRELLRHDMTMSLMWNLLLGSSSSLFNELYQDGLINERFYAHYSSASNYAFSALGGETPDPERLESTLTARLPNQALRQADLDRLKRKEMGEFLTLFENLEELAFAFNALHFRGIDLAEVPTIIEGITMGDLEEARGRHLTESARASSLVIPTPMTGAGGFR